MIDDELRTPIPVARPDGTVAMQQGAGDALDTRANMVNEQELPPETVLLYLRNIQQGPLGQTEWPNIADIMIRVKPLNEQTAWDVLNNLKAKELIEFQFVGMIPHFVLTDAGRALL